MEDHATLLLGFAENDLDDFLDLIVGSEEQARLDGGVPWGGGNSNLVFGILPVSCKNNQSEIKLPNHRPKVSELAPR